MDPTTTGESPGAAVLVGEAVEDWTGDALFYEYSVAVDPIGSGAIPPLPVHSFSPDLHATGPTRVVDLDLSAALGVPWTATSPGLLASFVVLLPHQSLHTPTVAASDLYYCLRGSGSTGFLRPEATDPSGRMRWAAGDFFILPAASDPTHRADEEGALLYRVTDAPLLSYLGVVPERPRFTPTRFDGATARARLAEVEHDPKAADRSRVSVLLGTTATPQTLTVTHTLWAMLGVLPAGRVQRPHRHQSVALDLITDCRPGCYSLIGDALAGDGAIIDPVRVDWEPAGAFVTPPGRFHSHHNESGHPAYLVPIQDAGLHTYLRSLDIRFAPPTD